MTPILMLGAGRMGGALIQGWFAAGAFGPRDLIVCEPHPTDQVTQAAADGAALNPPDDQLARARTVLLAVKPQVWREAAAQYSPLLAADAVIVSMAAGVGAGDLSPAFGGRRVARVMPTTAVAIGQGTASIHADDAEALERARRLFAPVATVVALESEDQLHAATGVSGSAPAYLYAFVEALGAAGVAAGLSAEVAHRLARATVTGSAALLAGSSEEPAELRRQVTSPAGTTAAALDVLMGEAGFGPLLEQAVAAAVKRSKELGA